MRETKQQVEKTVTHLHTNIYLSCILETAKGGKGEEGERGEIGEEEEEEGREEEEGGERRRREERKNVRPLYMESHSLIARAPFRPTLQL